MFRKRVKSLLLGVTIIMLPQFLPCALSRHTGDNFEHFVNDMWDSAIHQVVIQVLSKLDEIPSAPESPDAVLVLASGKYAVVSGSLVNNLIFWKDTSKLESVPVGLFKDRVYMHTDQPKPVRRDFYDLRGDWTHKFFTANLPNSSSTYDDIGIPVYNILTDRKDSAYGFINRMSAAQIFRKFHRVKVILVVEYEDLTRWARVEPTHAFFTQLVNFLPDAPPQTMAMCVVNVKKDFLRRDDLFQAGLEKVTQEVQKFADRIQSWEGGGQRELTVLKSVMEFNRVAFLWKPEANFTYPFAGPVDTFLEARFKQQLDRVVQATQFYSPNYSKKLFEEVAWQTWRLVEIFEEREILDKAWELGGVVYREADHEAVCGAMRELAGDETLLQILGRLKHALENESTSVSSSSAWVDKAVLLTRARNFLHQLVNESVISSNATDEFPTPLTYPEIVSHILRKYGRPCKFPGDANPQIDSSQVTCSSDGKKATVFGDIVKLSEVVGDTNVFSEWYSNSVLPCDSVNLKVLQIFATKLVVLDKNISAVGKELTLGIVAPTWEIGGERVEFNLSGTTGLDHIPSRIWTIPSVWGADGVNGLSGNRGTDGGYFVGIYGNFTTHSYKGRYTGRRSDPFKVVVEVHPGHGGRGQGGGPGADGRPFAEDAQVEDFPPARDYVPYFLDRMNVPYHQRLPGNLMFDYKSGILVSDEIYKVGQVGYDGGRFGIGGRKGAVGRPGKVVSIQLSELGLRSSRFDHRAILTPELKKASAGEPGTDGDWGTGGLGGRALSCTVTGRYSTPQWGGCHHTFRSKRGQDGREIDAYRFQPPELPSPPRSNPHVVFGAVVEDFLELAKSQDQMKPLSDNEWDFVEAVAANKVVNKSCYRTGSMTPLLQKLDQKLNRKWAWLEEKLDVRDFSESEENIDEDQYSNRVVDNPYKIMSQDFRNLSSDLEAVFSRPGNVNSTLLSLLEVAMDTKLIAVEGLAKSSTSRGNVNDTNFVLQEVSADLQNVIERMTLAEVKVILEKCANRSRTLEQLAADRLEEYGNTVVRPNLRESRNRQMDISSSRGNVTLEKMMTALNALTRAAHSVYFVIAKDSGIPSLTSSLPTVVAEDVEIGSTLERLFLHHLSDSLSSKNRRDMDFIATGFALHSEQRVGELRNGTLPWTEHLRQLKDHEFQRNDTSNPAHGWSRVDSINRYKLISTEVQDDYYDESKRLRKNMDARRYAVLDQLLTTYPSDQDGTSGPMSINSLKAVRAHERLIFDTGLKLIPDDKKQFMTTLYSSVDFAMDLLIQLRTHSNSAKNFTRVAIKMGNVREDQVPETEYDQWQEALFLTKFHLIEALHMEAVLGFSDLVQWRFPSSGGYHLVNVALSRQVVDAFKRGNLEDTLAPFRDSVLQMTSLVSGPQDTDVTRVQVSFTCGHAKSRSSSVSMTTNPRDWINTTAHLFSGKDVAVRIINGSGLMLDNTVLEKDNQSPSPVSTGAGYFVMHCLVYSESCHFRGMTYSSSGTPQDFYSRGGRLETVDKTLQFFNQFDWTPENHWSPVWWQAAEGTLPTHGIAVNIPAFFLGSRDERTQGFGGVMGNFEWKLHVHYYEGKMCNEEGSVAQLVN